MNANPLFPNDQTPGHDGSFVLSKQSQAVQPLGAKPDDPNPAADLIREKLARIYAEEPDALAEEHEAEVVPERSKHQQYMYELSTSGKSLAEIQTAWHNYYLGLPDEEKHQVWHEFYETNQAIQEKRLSTLAPPSRPTQPLPTLESQAHTQADPEPTPTTPAAYVSKPDALATAGKQDPRQIRQTIRRHVTADGRLRAKHHLQSLGFGLAVGFITLFIFLFGFFNEVLIAPFIQPSRTASATPIIVDPKAVAASSKPEVIIPKINLEIPVDFSQTSTDEATIENALNGGVVHYPSTVMPGQNGNAAFFGHSSNNIFNPGKYKFAFVLLHELVPGDTFYITYNGKVYIYKVFSKRVVEPSEIGVLGNVAGHSATATLITCDPPGTSLHRLVVVGDQISPDTTSNTHGSNTSATNASRQLPSNGPNLLSRLWHSIF